MDLLQEESLHLHAYEIKSATVIHPEFFKNLSYLRQLLPNDILSTRVLYDGTAELPILHNGYLNYRHHD